MSNRKPLSRGQWIAISAIIVPAALVIVGWFVIPPSKPKESQTAVASGDSNAVNSVSGNQNIVGNNNTVIQSHPFAPSQTTDKATDAPPQKKPTTAKRDQARAVTNTQIVNAPNGIAITGGTVTNPIVINAPPPVEITFNAAPVPSTDQQFEYEVKVVVSVNAPYTPVSLAFICDSEIKNVSSDFGQYSSVKLNGRSGIDGNYNKVGFLYFEGTPITPDHPLYVHLWASGPFRVTEIRQAKLTN